MELFILFKFSFFYIGPGISGGAFAAIIGILTAFGISLFAIIWYPIKKLFCYIRAKLKKL